MHISIPRRRRARRGFSLMELLIVVAILLIIGAIAVPKLSVAMMNAREMAAVRQIHTLHTVQAQYMSQFGRYAASLAELGPPSGGQPGPAGADLIGQDFAQGVKNGYNFKLEATPTGYVVNAIPATPGTTGRRTFFSDQSGIIRENWGAEPANASSKEIK
jgi:prepilin-type N-terminal cleavage/methylation domain-containing protein